MFKTDRRRKIELLDWVNENLEETYVHEANGEREEQRKDFQVNKFLGFGAVVIMIAAMGYVILAMMIRMFKPAIKQSNEQAPKQLLVKKEQSNNQQQGKGQRNKDRTSKQLPDVKTDDWKLVLVGPDHKLEKKLMSLLNWHH